MIAASVADLVSTEHALRSCGTCYEGNPILQSQSRRIGAKALGGVAIIAATRHLAPKHPRLAKGIKIALIVVYSGATVHNMRKAR